MQKHASTIENPRINPSVRREGMMPLLRGIYQPSLMFPLLTFEGKDKKIMIDYFSEDLEELEYLFWDMYCCLNKVALCHDIEEAPYLPMICEIFWDLR
jgi:hypothetical protein